MKNTILAITFFIFGWSAPLSAEVMTYQGRLKESNVPVNANRVFSFKFCDAESFGNCDTTPSGFQSFTVQNGLFKSTFTIPASNLTQGEWYLQVSVGVDAPSIQDLSPRERLTAVPYSVYSATAGYSPAALQKAGDTMTGQLTSISSVTITGNGGVYGLQVSSNVSLAGALYSANGNVGIGTAAPQYPLVVLGNPAGNIINAGDAANPWGATAGFGLDDFNTYPGAALYVNNAKVFNVESNGGAILGSTYMTADAVRNGLIVQGHVGIGTALPNYALEISSGAGEAGTIMSVSTGATNLFWVAGDGAHSIKFTGDGSGLTGVTGAAGTDSSKLPLTGGTLAGQLTLAGSTLTVTGDAFSVGGSTLVVINGNVGIGTTAPTLPLHVQRSDVNNGNNVMRVENTQASGYAALNYVTDSKSWNVGLAGSNAGGLQSKFYIHDGADFNVVVQDDGNVGIGTTNPAYRLVVSSGAGETGMIMAVSTGTTNIFSVDGSGVNALRFTGDGSGLTGVTGASGTDSSKLPLTGGTLAGQLTLSGSTLTVTGDAFSVGGSTLVVTNGYVGLGTNAPAARLDVVSDNGYLHFRSPNTSLIMNMIPQTYAPAILNNNGDGPLGFSIANNVKMWIDRQTLVGIGTQTPSYRLHVSSAAGEAGIIMAVSTGITNVFWVDGSGANALKFTGDGSGLTGVSGSDATKLPIAGGFMSGQLTNTSSITITGNGGVYGLQVSSNVSLAGALYSANGNVGIGTTGPVSRMDIKPSADNGASGLHIRSFNSDSKYISLWRGDNGGVIDVAGPAATPPPYLGITFDGTEKVRIDSSGNVGIGTVNPSAGLLVLEKTSENALVFTDAGTNRGMLGVAGSAGQISANSAADDTVLRALGNLHFAAGSGFATRMYLDSINGNVGIGTTGPSYRLHVSSGAGETGTVMAVSTGSTNIFWVDGYGANALKFTGDGSGLTGVTGASGTDSTRVLKTGDTMTGQLTNTSSVTITGNGGGAYGLQVSSNVSLAGALYSANGKVGIGTTSPADLFVVAGSLGNIGIPTNGNSIRYTYNGINYIQADGALSELRIRTGGTDRMVIKTAGNIGIGTTAPATKFEVAGGSVTISGAEAGLLFDGPSRKIAPTTSVTEGAGLYVSTHVYIIGFSSAAKYYGDGSALTGVSGSDVTKLPLGGGTLTGQLTLSGSSLTVTGAVAGQSYSANGIILFSSDGVKATDNLNPVSSITIAAGGGVTGGTPKAGGYVSILSGKAEGSGFPIDVGFGGDVRIFARKGANARGGDVLIKSGRTDGYASAGQRSVIDLDAGGYDKDVTDTTGGRVLIEAPTWPDGGGSGGTYQRGGHVTITGGNGTTGTGGSGTGGNIVLKPGTGPGGLGNVGISTGVPQARLDVLAGGSAQTDMAQLWRNSAGTIVSSVSATGVLMAGKFIGDGSGLTGVSASDASKLPLAGGTMAGDITMGGNDLYAVSTITATGDITAARYQIAGSTVLAILPGTGSLGVGVSAGRVNVGTSNSFLGYQAGYSNTTGSNNSFLGYNAGAADSTGGENSFLGSYTGFNNTTGGSNSFLGTFVGYSNTTGFNNSFLGTYAGYSNTTGSNNSFLGTYAGYNTKAGSANAVFGTDAGKGVLNNSFSSATIMGYQAGFGLTTGSDNIFLGFQTGYNVTTGTGNILIGYGKDTSAPGANNELNIGGVLYGDLSAKTIGISRKAPEAALDIVSTGTVQTQFAQIWRDSAGVIKSSMSATGVLMAGKFIGDGSGLIGVSATDNTKLPLGGGTMAGDITMGGNDLYAVSTITATGDITAARYQIAGSTVLAVLPGTGSLGVGVNAGRVNTASFNLFLGNNTGLSNTTGMANSFLGNAAGFDNTTGSKNSVVGFNAGLRNQIGSANAIFGYQAGYGVTGNSFSSSTLLGYQAGSGLTTGSGNILIGVDTGNSLTTGFGNIIVGYDADASAPTASGELNIGGVLYGDLSARTIGISTRVPQAALDIVSTGTVQTQFAQIWRDSSGVIKSSMSATGVLMAGRFIGDGSALSGVSATDATKLPLTGGDLSGAFSVNSASVSIRYANEALYIADPAGGMIPNIRLARDAGSYWDIGGAGGGTPLVFQYAGNNRLFMSSDGYLTINDAGQVTDRLKIRPGVSDAYALRVSSSDGVADNLTLKGSGELSMIGPLLAVGNISAARYQIGGSTVVAVLTGADSLGIGISAGAVNTGADNSFLGFRAGYVNTSGGQNTFAGSNAGRFNTTGNLNSFFGYASGIGNLTGNNNAFLGNEAGSSNTTGSNNIFVGYASGWGNIGGSANVITGVEAGGAGGGGGNISSSTIIGYRAGLNLTTSSDNILLGFQAGYNVTTGAGNIVIGYGKDTSASTANNELNIGGVLYGDLSARTIGISTRVPQAALDIVSTGSAVNQYAQIWRDSTGLVVASMTSTGRLSGDGSGLTAVSANDATKLPLTGGRLSNWLEMGNNSTMTVTGNAFSVGGSTLVVTAGHVGINWSTPDAPLVVNAMSGETYIAKLGTSGINISIGGAIQTTGTGHGAISGNPRGIGAVDLQTKRTNATYVASGDYSALLGGYDNRATGNNSAVLSGFFNAASGVSAAVLTGISNTASNSYAAVGGGRDNTASGTSSFIGGGGRDGSGYPPQGNTASQAFAAIAGGAFNVVSGSNSFIGAGAYNVVTGTSAVTAGGEGNKASGMWSAIGGGRVNNASGIYSAVSGGTNNTASGGYSAVAGGNANVATGLLAAVSGGDSNTASGQYSAVAGGMNNISSGEMSVVSGGRYNESAGHNSFIGGGGVDAGGYGGANKAQGDWSGIVAGIFNVVSGSSSFVGGGAYNVAAGTSSVIAGGDNNRTENFFSSVGGGKSNTARDLYATVGGGSTNNANNSLATIGGGGFHTIDAPYGTVAGGNNNKIQSFATAGFIGGGENNISTGAYSAIGGGRVNSSSGAYSAVLGGYGNAAEGAYSAVAGGNTNRAYGANSAVSGGKLNSALGDFSAIAGGDNNSANAPDSIVAGGNFNLAGGQLSAVAGGNYNAALGMASFIGGGGSNKTGLTAWGAVAFGANNAAMGQYSFAAGRTSTSAYDGSFTWADSQGIDVVNNIPDQVMFKAKGGFWVSTGTVYTNPALYIDAGNNIGIGTAFPTAKLHLANAGDGIKFPDGSLMTTAGVGSASNLANITDAIINGDSDSNLTGSVRLQTAGLDRLYVSTNGNVGIGTIYPLVNLHNSGPAILANNTSIDVDTYGQSVIAGQIIDTGFLATSGVGGRATSPGATWGIGHNNADLLFAAGDSTIANTMQIFMQATWKRNLALVPVSGSVGVGLAAATVPDQKLTVIGNISQTGVLISSGTGNSYFAGNVGIGTPVPVAMLDVNGTARLARQLVESRDAGGTMSAADSGKTITVNSASPQAIMLPVGTAGTIGAQFTFVKLGAGKVTITAGATDFIADSSMAGGIYNDAVSPAYAIITLRLVTSNQWMLVGGEGAWVTQ